MAKTYWDNDGKYQRAADRLQELIPSEGSVENPFKNKALEKFRKAANAYYDLYNNGGCNRAQAITKLFKVRLSDYRNRNRYDFYQVLYDRVEEQMDLIIEAAAKEQNIALTDEKPVDSYDDLWNALQRIDCAAVGMPTFKVRHEGGLDAFVQNIVDAIVATYENKQ